MQGRSYNGLLPKIAHQRISVVSPPPRGLSPARVQTIYDELQQDQVGAFGGGYNYIIVNVAPSPPPRRRAIPTSKITYIEDVTDTNNLQTLARETRMMRRDADNLLIRLNEGLPPPLFSLRSIPLRSSGDLREAIDIRRRYVHERNNPHIPYSQIRNNVYRMSMYQDPDKYQLRGQGNLACLSYAGGRPIPKRRRFYPEDKIRDDVNFRSFYFKLRDAANYGRQYIKQVYQPLYRSQKTIMGGLIDEPKKERKEYESKWVTRALAKADVPTPPPRKQSATSSPRQGVSVTLPGPRKSIVEPPEVKPKVENMPEEKVVVKIPKNEADLPVAVNPAEVEKTVKVPSATTKTEPPPAKSEPAPAPVEVPAPPVEQPAPEPVKEEPVVVEKPAPVETPAPPPPEPTAQSSPETAAPPKEEPVQAPVEAAPAEEPKTVEPSAPVVEAPEPAKEPETVAEAPPAEAASIPAATEAEATPAAAPVEDTSNKGEEIAEVEIEEAVVEADDVDVQIEEQTVEDVCEVQIEENDLEIGNQSAVDEPDMEELQQSESEPVVHQSEQNEMVESELYEIHESEQNLIQESEQNPIQESEQNLMQESEQNPIQELEHISIKESEQNTIQESEQTLIPESESNIAHESEKNIDSVPEPEPVESEPQPEPVESEPQPEPVESEPEPEQIPCAEEDTTAAGVSIVVADIDGPIAHEPQDAELDAPLTVEEIQANAERRRTEFAKLLEEHAEIVGTVQRLESDGGVQEAAAAENEI